MKVEIRIEFSDGTILTTKSDGIISGLEETANLILSRQLLGPKTTDGTFGRPISVTIKEI